MSCSYLHFKKIIKVIVLFINLFYPAKYIMIKKMNNDLRLYNEGQNAILKMRSDTYSIKGKWIFGTPWERFGLYNSYVILRKDGKILNIPAHSGELVPGSTEDLIEYIIRNKNDIEKPISPMTLELDPTYICTSLGCGGRCFSAEYRSHSPKSTISFNLLKEIIDDFSLNGGRILRFDGGGDPLSHSDVRNGKLLNIAQKLGLKTTILTSGDLLHITELEKIGESGCYLRVSLNAATNKTRQLFHGNSVEIDKIFQKIRDFANWLLLNNSSLPIGGTYLLDELNYHELFLCAKKAKDNGFSHFSVRRVLGPNHLRPKFSEFILANIKEQFYKVNELSCPQFKVFLPWRSLNEEDLNPSRGDFDTKRCWQSTFKTVIEPSVNETNGFRAQLCGRYRGEGIGQLMQLPSLLSSNTGSGWTNIWQNSFSFYPYSRQSLPKICASCIDRGFILMVDQIIDFVKNSIDSFQIYHLDNQN